VSELHIKAPCGFEARVNEDALKDLEIYDAVRQFISDLDRGAPPDVRGTCEALLGAQGYRAFVNFEKKHAGMVRVDHASELINAVIQTLNGKKK
jgi:hypothetical protein